MSRMCLFFVVTPVIDYVIDDTSSFSAELPGKQTPLEHSDIAHFFPSHACIRTATALCMIDYLCKSLRIISLVWPTRLIFLAMGEVLSFGFNLAVSFPGAVRAARHVLYCCHRG